MKKENIFKITFISLLFIGLIVYLIFIIFYKNKNVKTTLTQTQVCNKSHTCDCSNKGVPCTCKYKNASNEEEHLLCSSEYSPCEKAYDCNCENKEKCIKKHK